MLRRLLQRRGAAVWAPKFISNAEPRYPKLIVPVRNCGRRRKRCRGVCHYISMGLASEVDIQRFGAKNPARVMQQFGAAAERPANLGFIIGLRKCAKIGGGDGYVRITTADAVVAERVIDASIGEAARGVEQHMVMDHKTGAATQRAKPIYIAFQIGCFRESA